MLDKEQKKWMKEYLLPTAKYSHDGKEPTLNCDCCDKVIRIGEQLYYETTGYTPYCEDRDCTEGLAVFGTCLEPCWWDEDGDFWKYWDKLIKESEVE